MSPERPFTGTPRYEVVRELGAGGMGIVYEVIDRDEGNRRVALKVLRRSDPESLIRLKREFRALADARHPNLATLYELVSDGQTCFFTLELIDGVDALTWVRPGRQVRASLPTGALEATIRTPSSRTEALDLERLHRVFRQLAQGVAALHGMGQLHRDLKPSNVMVTTEGRVVILDFGLVSDLVGGERSLSELDGQTIVGTAAYMAPEQAGQGELTPAADWYAFGVMLFQALTGRLPFEGPALQVMLEKQRHAAPTVFELAPESSTHLASLCAALMRLEPSARPNAAHVLEALGALTPPTLEKPKATTLLGRDAELMQLREVFDEAQSSRRPRVVRVLGESGIGKTALVRQAMLEAEAAGALVLAGRCSERENVPFKALDGIIDSLARYLASLTAERADALLPREANALAHMFPVLMRSLAFREAPNREIRDLVEQRRRAVSALRELLGRMTDRKPVIAFIDDVQWGDLDSEDVLNEVLQGPDAPALVLIATGRVTETTLSTLRMPMREIIVGPLSLEVCTTLAAGTASHERAETVARESQGNPFLLMQLARFGSASTTSTLASLIERRVTELKPAERALLEVTAVAGAPVLEAVALAAAGLEPAQADAVLALKSARLIRAASHDRLEMWHDRLRDAVLAQLAPQRLLERHLWLAEKLEQLSAPDQQQVEQTALHLAGAGLIERAAGATLRAAAGARAQLAFERAALLYQRALSQLPATDPRRESTLIAWGDALSLAGRGAQAAEAYRQAWSARGLETGSLALELRRRAAEQLLRAGHIDQGLSTIREVLNAVGMTLAPTPWRALLALAFRRLHVMLRGLNFSARATEAIRPEDLVRIDVCWSVSVGLGMVDTIRGASFQTRQLLLALDAGEPMRIARALAAEAAFVATDGIRAEPRSRGLLERARALALEGGDGGLMGLIDFCDGLTHFLVGDWAQAQQLSARAERQFEDIGSGVSWEAASARLFSVWSLFYLGEMAELSKRIPALVREAESRGDLYALTSLKCGLSNVSLLAADDPKGARTAAREAMAKWSATSFHFQHYWALLSEGLIDLYEGTASDGWVRTQAAWPSLKASQLLRIQNVRIEATYLKARLALASGRTEAALTAAATLRRENIGWANGFALLIRAATEPAERSGLLAQALAVFEHERMGLFAAATKLALSQTQTEPQRHTNERAATEWLQAQGIVNPARMIAVLLPHGT